MDMDIVLAFLLWGISVFLSF